MKNNNYVKKSIMTGILRLTGLNNFVECSV